MLMNQSETISKESSSANKNHTSLSSANTSSSSSSSTSLTFGNGSGSGTISSVMPHHVSTMNQNGLHNNASNHQTTNVYQNPNNPFLDSIITDFQPIPNASSGSHKHSLSSNQAHLSSISSLSISSAASTTSATTNPTVTGPTATTNTASNTPVVGMPNNPFLTYLNARHDDSKNSSGLERRANTPEPSKRNYNFDTTSYKNRAKSIYEDISNTVIKGSQMLQDKSKTWVPPNDRELLIRSKLKTGWSSRSNGQSPSHQQMSMSPLHAMTTSTKANNTLASLGFGSPDQSSNQTGITDAEFLEIEHVMQRASLIEQKETNRVGKLYQRYAGMNRPHGNGETTCLICNSNFGILGATPRICNDCLKNCCVSCCIDTLSSNKQSTIWLCKICAEYRDFWKKSGAWFLKRIPHLTPNELRNTEKEHRPSRHAAEDHSDEEAIEDYKRVQQRKSQVINDSHRRHNDDNDHNHDDDHDDNDDNDEEDEDDDDIDYKFNKVINASIKNKSRTATTASSAAATTSSTSKMLLSATSAMKKQSMNRSSPSSSNSSSFDANNNLDATGFNANIINNHTITSNVNNEDNLKIINDLKSISSKESLNTDFNKSLTDQVATTRHLVKPNLQMAATAAAATKSTSLNDHTITSETHVPLSDGSLGFLRFNVEYISSLLQLKIYLISASKLPAKDSNGLSDPYVKIHLLPGIAKATKLRSKTIYKNLNPQFNETLHYDGITNDDMETKTLRLTVLDEDKFGFDFIGEYRLPLKTLLRNELNEFYVALDSKQEIGDETNSQFRGKINFALKYNKQNNCLFIKIIRCTQLLPMDNGKSSDPFIEICLTPSPKEGKAHKLKSTIKWKTLDPEYNEEFKFANIDLKTLLTKTIEISVWDKDFGKNDFIGAVQLGQQRSGEELKHFYTMIKNPDLYHEQWHTLHMRDEIAPRYED